MTIENLDSGSTYAMNVVTRLTGLAADTIRAWERRYGAVVPHRTEGKTRRYSVGDVQKLLLLKEATSRGHRIAMVARQSVEELTDMLSTEQAMAASGAEHPQIENELIAIRASYFDAIECFDTVRGEAVLRRVLAELGQRDFLYNILMPIMRETGDRWAYGKFSVAHEHVISIQMRNVMDEFLRSVPSTSSMRKILIGTPSGHRHEFGALSAAMLASLRGFPTIYLGMDLPAFDIATAAEISGAKLAMLSIVRDSFPKEEKMLAEDLATLTETLDVWIGCHRQNRLVKLLPDVRFFHDFEQLELALMDLI